MFSSWAAPGPRSAALTLALMLLVSCGPAAAPSRDTGSLVGPQTAMPRGTLRLASHVEPETLSPKFAGGSGRAEALWIFNSNLAYRDLAGTPHPMLAGELPSRENGSWVVNPDGTMVTTYRLRRSARWHDDVPITAGDYVFAYEVYVDRDVAVSNPLPEPLMDRLVAADDYTLIINWKEPYINANALGHQQLNPLARHVYEPRFRASRASFAVGEEWTTAYIGSGPFRLESWTPGAELVARAHLGFALGPPKLETLVIRFVVDPNVQLASILSGDVDMVSSPGVRANEAAIARDRWAMTGEGTVTAWSTRTSYVEFQFREVSAWQAAVTDVRVRRALLHAMDRAGIADAVNVGFAGVADAFITPSDPLFSDVDRIITKYPYDPNAAVALLGEAGWPRSTASGLAANAAGQMFDVELAVTSSQASIATVAADNWKAAGVTANMFVIPAARARDNELRSSFKAASLNGRTVGPDTFVWTADGFPTAENRWTGSNRGSFFDAEVDRLHRLRVTALDPSEQRAATIAVLKRMTELAGVQPLIYSVEVILARKHVVGPVGNYGPQEGITWNVHEWSIR